MSGEVSHVETPEVIGHFINGKVVGGHGSDTTEVYDPAVGIKTGKVLSADADDVNHVVAAAKNAAPAWAQSSLTKRTKTLFAFHEKLSAASDRLARVITAEHGKILSDAMGEISRGMETVEFACGIIEHLKGGYSDHVSTDVDVYSIREPLGVVAGITPFNFPVMVPLWMAPVAIATGNAFILKPSPRDPSASVMLAELWRDAGLPDGVFNVLQGGKEAVDALLAHPDVDAVSFVGSTPIAKYVYETGTRNGKRVQALGGAKNHVVVLPDADMDLASEYLNSAAFGSAGERCMAISVAVAVGGGADELVDRVAKRASNIHVAAGTDPRAEMGPLVSRSSLDRVVRIVTEAESDGVKLVTDGRRLRVPGHEQGFFVGPTVIDNVKPTMSAYKEEIFGPVLSVMRVDNVDSAIALINDNPYGNGTGIFTRSGANARKFVRNVKVGMVGVNIPIPVPISWYSFGGWNESLFGDLHIYGPDGVRFFTRGKVITQRWPEPAAPSEASFAFPSHS
jgi:malonate-semialdehyde dehydrogenase (acetylating)/methylmalonate-semialdehyde dehydrogenase